MACSVSDFSFLFSSFCLHCPAIEMQSIFNFCQRLQFLLQWRFSVCIKRLSFLYVSFVSIFYQLSIGKSTSVVTFMEYQFHIFFFFYYLVIQCPIIFIKGFHTFSFFFFFYSARQYSYSFLKWNIWYNSQVIFYIIVPCIYQFLKFEIYIFTQTFFFYTMMQIKKIYKRWSNTIPH